MLFGSIAVARLFRAVRAAVFLDLASPTFIRARGVASFPRVDSLLRAAVQSGLNQIDEMAGGALSWRGSGDASARPRLTTPRKYGKLAR